MEKTVGIVPEAQSRIYVVTDSHSRLAVEVGAESIEAAQEQYILAMEEQGLVHGVLEIFRKDQVA